MCVHAAVQLQYIRMYSLQQNIKRGALSVYNNFVQRRQIIKSAKEFRESSRVEGTVTILHI